VGPTRLTRGSPGERFRHASGCSTAIPAPDHRSRAGCKRARGRQRRLRGGGGTGDGRASDHRVPGPGTARVLGAALPTGRPCDTVILPSGRAVTVSLIDSAVRWPSPGRRTWASTASGAGRGQRRCRSSGPAGRATGGGARCWPAWRRAALRRAQRHPRFPAWHWSATGTAHRTVTCRWRRAFHAAHAPCVPDYRSHLVAAAAMMQATVPTWCRPGRLLDRKRRHPSGHASKGVASGQRSVWYRARGAFGQQSRRYAPAPADGRAAL